MDLQAKLKAKCDEVKSMASHVQELQERVRDVEGERLRVEAKWNREDKRGRAVTAKMSQHSTQSSPSSVRYVVFIMLFVFYLSYCACASFQIRK